MKKPELIKALEKPLIQLVEIAKPLQGIQQPNVPAGYIRLASGLIVRS